MIPEVPMVVFASLSPYWMLASSYFLRYGSYWEDWELVTVIKAKEPVVAAEHWTSVGSDVCKFGKVPLDVRGQWATLEEVTGVPAWTMVVMSCSSMQHRRSPWRSWFILSFLFFLFFCEDEDGWRRRGWSDLILTSTSLCTYRLLVWFVSF